MIERWQDLSEWEQREVLAPAALHLGITPEEAVALVSAEFAKAMREALESASDADIPAELATLALITEAITGQHITAIKRGQAERSLTEFPPDFDRLAYHMRRFTGSLLPSDPAWVREAYTAYYFIVDGNPIMIERYLKDLGYREAFAGSPTACRVSDVTAMGPTEG